MAILLLIIINLTFVCMGLYSSMFGAVWPVAYLDLGASISHNSLFSTIITIGTICAGLLGVRIQRKLGAGTTSFVALGVISAVCLSYSYIYQFPLFVALAFPLGFSNGLLDVTVNNYVAKNYPPQYMSWLHCAWGLGSLGAPMIAAYFIAGGNWRLGYQLIAFIQMAIVAALFFMRKDWVAPSTERQSAVSKSIKPTTSVLNIKGVKPLLVSLFFYGGIEGAVNYWGSTYLVVNRGFSNNEAAKWMSLFFAGMMIIRFSVGFLSIKVSYQTIVTGSQWVLIIGALLLLLPLGKSLVFVGLFLLGAGCGPIVPGIIHLAPKRFGGELAQEVIGLQTVSLYCGIMSFPILVGWAGERTKMLALPILLLLGAVIHYLASLRTNKLLKSEGRLVY